MKFITLIPLFVAMHAVDRVFSVHITKNYEMAPIHENIQPLDAELSVEYTIYCLKNTNLNMNDKMIKLDEKTMRKSPILQSIFDTDLDTKELEISIDACHQKTLDMVLAFMKGDSTIWTQMTPLIVQDLMIMADFLQLQGLMDQSILWILKRSKFSLSKFPFSKQFQKTEYYQEIRALLKLDIAEIRLDTSYLKLKVKGKGLFNKLKQVKRISSLNLEVMGTMTAPNHNYNYSLVANTLELAHYDQSKLAFLANSVHYPQLKRLFLSETHLSDIGKLSEALNEGRMPQLQELDISYNYIRLETLELNAEIPLKKLNLSSCMLWNALPLVKALKKMTHLEELDLSSNPLVLNSFELDMPTPLKILDLSSCHLSNVSFLTSILNTMPQLMELNLFYNPIDLDTFQINEPISVKVLKLGISHLSSLTNLANVLYKMPHLEELYFFDVYYGIQWKTLRLEKAIPLKILDLSFTDLTFADYLTIFLLPKMPKLERLNLTGNRDIDLDSFILKSEIDLKYLSLSFCALYRISSLANILYKMPKLEELDLSFNDNIKWKTFQLERDISITRLKLNDCDLTDIAFLANLLYHMPKLEELDLSNNPNIIWTSFQLNRNVPLKRLHLDLIDDSALDHVLDKMPELDQSNIDYREQKCCLMM